MIPIHASHVAGSLPLSKPDGFRVPVLKNLQQCRFPMCEGILRTTSPLFESKKGERLCRHGIKEHQI